MKVKPTDSYRIDEICRAWRISRAAAESAITVCGFFRIGDLVRLPVEQSKVGSDLYQECHFQQDMIIAAMQRQVRRFDESKQS